MMCINIIIPPIPRYSKWYIRLVCSHNDKNSVYISQFSPKTLFKSKSITINCTAENFSVHYKELFIPVLTQINKIPQTQ
jgi:hypothetical protein